MSGDLFTRPLEYDAGDERRDSRPSEGQGSACGRACLRFLRLLRVTLGWLLSVWRLACVVPRQAVLRARQQQHADDPQDEDQYRGRRHPQVIQVVRHLRSHDGDHEDTDDERCLQDQRQARGLVGQGPFRADTECVECNQHDGLDGDATENVSDRDTDSMLKRR